MAEHNTTAFCKYQQGVYRFRKVGHLTGVVTQRGYAKRCLLVITVHIRNALQIKRYVIPLSVHSQGAIHHMGFGNAS